jgi:hypothetical protein
MFTLTARPQRLCDGLSRRALLRAGALGAFGLSLPDVLRAMAAAPTSLPGFGRARRCILLFLTGGPPQHDTWDMKPDAPAEIRGELRPIDTAVPGLRVSELCPLLASRLDRCTLMRSVTHADTVHTSAGYTMLTGVYHPTPNEATAENIRPTPDDHPHLGSLVSYARQHGYAPLAESAPAGRLPDFIALPETIRDANVNTFPGQDAGFLGRRYGPLLIEADERRERLLRPEILLPAEITTDRYRTRRELFARLDAAAESLARMQTAAGPIAAIRDHYAQAFELVGSPAARQAFDLEQESDSTRQRYGAHLFGRGCLMARRLAEAGVPLVTVYWHYEGPDDSPVWDTHWNNFRHLRGRLMPPTDQALAALLDDLTDRGLLADTLLVVMGEFGRTPRINGYAGRDHWPHAQSILLAGAGLPQGAAYGASDKRGAYPADRPVTPPDLTATLLHLLGVPLEMTLTTPAGRSLPACQGTPIAKLVS